MIFRVHIMLCLLGLFPFLLLTACQSKNDSIIPSQINEQKENPTPAIIPQEASQKEIPLFDLILNANVESSEYQQQFKSLLHSFDKNNLNCYIGLYQESLLHYAVARNMEWSVSQLLQAGVMPKIKNRMGLTPVALAAKKGYASILKMLLEADPKTLEEADSIDGFFPLHYAAIENHFECVKIMLQNQKALASMLQLRDRFHRSAFHLAVEFSDLKTVQCFLDAPVKFSDFATFYDLNQALNIASDKIDSDRLNLILKYGANPNIHNAEGRSPLSRIAQKECLDSFKVLLNYHVDPQFADKDGRTALHYAAEFARIDQLTLLANQNIPLNIEDQKGWTPICYAAIHNHFDVVSFFLNHKISKDHKTRDGKSLLILATQSRSTDIAKLLISQKCNLNCSDETGKTALMIATESLQDEIFDLLIQNGADSNLRDKNGETILEIAKKVKNTHVIKWCNAF